MSFDLGEPIFCFVMFEVVVYMVGKSYGSPWLAVSILPILFITVCLFMLIVRLIRRH